MNLRNRLKKILEQFEQESNFKYMDIQELGGYDVSNEVEFYPEHPNFRVIYDEINKNIKNDKEEISESHIRRELQKMQNDGLVIIDTQKVHGYSSLAGHFNNDSERIILTTKGGKKLQYLLHKAWENPISLFLSALAFLISLASLLVTILIK
ncbi:MAG: hypothetical protein WD335_03610 [Candidatus Paceibacterota bacterium]